MYHSFCRINQMQKPLYLIDIAKLDRYREKALGRYEGVPNIFHFNETKKFWRHPVFFIFIKCKCARMASGLERTDVYSGRL